MRLKRYLTGKSGVTVLVISLAVTLLSVLVLGALAWFYRAPLLVFDLRTEQFAQVVVRPPLSALTVRDATLRGLTEACAGRDSFTGVVEAPQGAILTYRWRPGSVSVAISNGPLRLTNAEGPCTEREGEFSVVLEVPADGEASLVLPIAGPVEVGSELSNAAPPLGNLPRRLDLLLDGSFTVFGRTIQIWGAPSLYPISTDPLPLPAGSRVGALPANPEDADAWYGIALAGSDGFVVRATADADRVTLFRASDRDGELAYSFGLFSAIVGDPVIGTLALIIFFLVTAVQLVASWMGLWVEDDRADRWRRWGRRGR